MQRNYLKRILALMLAAGSVLMGCACGGKDVQPPAPTIALPTATPALLPQNGGTLRLPMPANADKADPLSVTTEEMMTMFSLIFEGLIRIDSTNQLVPALAENWSCDASGRVWTVKLRKEAKWHDTGAPISANDVLYTYNTIVAMGGASYYSYMTSRIEGIAAVDQSTVQITMKDAGILSLYALNFPIVRSDPATLAVGTGPYKMDAVTAGTVRLVANENWWKQRPYIDVVEFIERDSNETALASYEAGQLDMVPTSAVTAGRYREEGVTKVADLMTQTAEVLLVNHGNAVLRDVNVRRAIAYAINRSEMISNVYMNRAQASDVPIAPDSWMYESKSKIYDHSTATALSLLGESGWTGVNEEGFLTKNGRPGNELSLRLLYSDSADITRKNAAAVIAEQLIKLGIKVELIEAAYSLTDGGEYVSKLENGDFDIALVGFNLARDADLSQFLNASGGRNYGKYSNAQMETLMKHMIVAPDEPALREAASAFQLRFAEELPFIVLCFRLSSIVYSARVKGISLVREPDIFRDIDKWFMEYQ